MERKSSDENLKTKIKFKKSENGLDFEPTNIERPSIEIVKLEKEYQGSTDNKSCSGESDVSGHDKTSSNRTEENSFFHAGNIKQEPTESEMQTFAHHTMNELLGLYGYEQVGESDIKRIRPIKHQLPISLQKQQENLSELSPTELQACTSQSMRSYSDDDEVKCAWCGNPSHPAFTLKEDDLLKSFCSEKCFAACRRAKFKKTRSNANTSLNESLIYGGKKNNLSSSESDREQPDTLGCTSPSNMTKRKAGKIFYQNDNQERFVVGSSENLYKNKPTWLIKDQDTEKKEDTRGSFFKKNVLRNGSADPISERISKPKRKNSPQRHKNDYCFPKKGAGNTFDYNSESAVRQNKQREKSGRKVSSELKSTFRSPLETADQQSINSLNQSPVFNFQPHLNQAFMGFPGLINPTIGPPKLDLDSFRLGMLAACSQPKPESDPGHVYDNGFNSETPMRQSGIKTSSTPNKSANCSNNFEKSDLSSCAKLSSHKEEYMPTTDEPKTGKNGSIQALDDNENAAFPFFRNFPSPFLMVPFPIPIPIPFVLPIPFDGTKPLNSKNNESENATTESCNYCHDDMEGEESETHSLRFSWGLKTEKDKFVSNPSDRESEQNCLGSVKTLDEQRTGSVCAAIDLSVRTRDNLTETSYSSGCHSKRRLDDDQKPNQKVKVIKLS